MAKKRASRVQDFSPNKAAVELYARQLRSIAREVSRICSPLSMQEYSEPELFFQMGKVSDALAAYAEIIDPWAEAVAEKTVLDLSKRNLKLWKSASRSISRQIATGFGDPLTASVIRDQIQQNVALIKDIPLGTRQRVTRFVRKSVAEGRRAESLAQDLMNTGQFSESRAALIARTEISKASTEITRVRAVGYASPGYIWRTSMDGAVRPSHGDMEGKFVAWNDPPELDGMTGHAGEFPNCRCYPEVIVPDEESAVMHGAAAREMAG